MGKGTGPDPSDPASVNANEVVDIPTPKDPYS